MTEARKISGPEVLFRGGQARKLATRDANNFEMRYIDFTRALLEAFHAYV